MLRVYIALYILVIASTCNAQGSKSDFKNEVVRLYWANQHSLDSVNFLGCALDYYNKMDSLLNVVYNYYTTRLDSRKFEELKKDQQLWLFKKNKYLKESAKEIYDDKRYKNFNEDFKKSFVLNRRSDFIAERIMEILKNW